MTIKALFVAGNSNASDGLWVTDGTDVGTQEILAMPFNGGLKMLSLGDKVVFSPFVPTGSGANYSLYVSDGTISGTHEILPPAQTPYGYYLIDSIAPIGSRAIAATNLFKTLVVTDGTEQGTVVLNSPKLPVPFNWFVESPLYSLGNKVIFEAPSVHATYNGQADDLWVTDGTSAGTLPIDVAGAAVSGLNPGNITVFGDKALFTGKDSAGHVLALWVTDGTAAGTFEINNASLPATSAPNRLFAFGSKVLFNSLGLASGLWITDGTAAGTQQLAVSLPNSTRLFPNRNLAANPLVAFGGKALLLGLDGNLNTGLWITDGTGAGTTMLSTPNLKFTSGDTSTPGNNGNPTSFFVFGSKVLFEGINSIGKRGLWVTDGTSAGTSEITPANTYSSGLLTNGLPRFALAGNGVVFSGIDAGGKVSLWFTDGTSAGTHEISVTTGPSTNDTLPNSITSFDLPLVLRIGALDVNQQLELIYITYFNRSADGSGFTFWSGQNTTAQVAGQTAAVALTNIANSFAPQTETVALYSFLAPLLSGGAVNLNTPAAQAGLTAFIGSVYQNLFGRATDPAGQTYWVGQITGGAVGLGAAALAIASGATGTDATEVLNKITVAWDFTNRTSAAGLGTAAPLAASYLTAAGNVLSGVDGVSLNDASVTAGESATTAFISGSGTGHATAAATNAESPIIISVSNAVIDPGAGGHMISFLAGASADTLVLHAGGVDEVSGFDPGTDVLDLRTLLSEANVSLTGGVGTLSKYLTVVDQGADALVNFTSTGQGGSSTVAVLHGLGSTVTSLDGLVAQGAIRIS